MNTTKQAIQTIVAVALALVVIHTDDVRATSSIGNPTTTVSISSCGSSPSLGQGSDARSGTVKTGSGATGCTITNGNAAHEAGGGHDAGITHFAHCIVQTLASTNRSTMSYVPDKNSIVVSGLSGGIDITWVCL
jgi:hypothetical protein